MACRAKAVKKKKSRRRPGELIVFALAVGSQEVKHVSVLRAAALRSSRLARSPLAFHASRLAFNQSMASAQPAHLVVLLHGVAGSPANLEGARSLTCLSAQVLTPLAQKVMAEVLRESLPDALVYVPAVYSLLVRAPASLALTHSLSASASLSLTLCPLSR